MAVRMLQVYLTMLAGGTKRSKCQIKMRGNLKGVIGLASSTIVVVHLKDIIIEIEDFFETHQEGGVFMGFISTSRFR